MLAKRRCCNDMNGSGPHSDKWVAGAMSVCFSNGHSFEEEAKNRYGVTVQVHSKLDGEQRRKQNLKSIGRGGVEKTRTR